MLPDGLLTDYSERFYGFGTWSAKIWFVGIEEAGGRNENEVARRLITWKAHGQRELEDAPEFYPACNNCSWHGENASLQPTWRQLIRVLSLARGETRGEAALLEYQRDQLCVRDGETCLVELLPLPSPDTVKWNYKNWSSLPWLKSRGSYILKMRASRENELRRRVKVNNPGVVVFYGLELPDKISLLPSWSSIAGGRFEQAVQGKQILLWRQTGNTLFFVMRHPTAESDDYFSEIGSFFRKNHRNLF